MKKTLREVNNEDRARKAVVYPGYEDIQYYEHLLDTKTQNLFDQLGMKAVHAVRATDGDPDGHKALADIFESTKSIPDKVKAIHELLPQLDAPTWWYTKLGRLE